MSAQTVKIAGDPWSPWMIGKEGTKPTGGIFIEITKEIFKRANMKADITLYPFKRGLKLVKNGKHDIILMVSKSAEREKFLLFSDPILTDPYYVYYHKDFTKTFSWNNLSDLKGLTIGTADGFNYGKEFNNAVKKFGIKLRPVKKDLNNVRKLEKGKVKLIILNKTSAELLIRENPSFKGKLVATDKALYKADYFFGLSKKSSFKSNIDKINTIAKKLQSDGTFNKIITRGK